MTKIRFEFANDTTGDIPRDTMAAAADAGYPTVDLPTGTTIQTGEESWRAFITTASDLDCVLAHAAVHLRNSGLLGDWTLGG